MASFHGSVEGKGRLIHYCAPAKARWRRSRGKIRARGLRRRDGIYESHANMGDGGYALVARNVRCDNL
jgi:hypothetical protein